MAEKKALGTFEKYLSLWVILCIMPGILLGKPFRVFLPPNRVSAEPSN